MQIPEELRKYGTPIDIEGICAQEPDLIKRYMLRLQLEKQEAERKLKLEEWRSRQISFKNKQ